MFSFQPKSEKHTTVEITISNRTVFRVVVAAILSILFFGALTQASHALVLIGAALFLALALDGPVRWLADHIPGKKKGSRTLATAASFLVVIALLVGFLVSIVPPLVSQTTTFLSAAPGLVEDAKNENTALGRTVRQYHLQDQTDKLSEQLSERLDDLSGNAVTALTKVTGSIFSIITVLVLAFMMLIEGPRWLNFIRKQLPKRHHDRVDTVARDMYKVIRGFVNGQVTLAAFAAAFIVVPLFILDISYPIALMVIVFICGLIPLVGHTIGAIIVSIVALFTSVPAAIFILLFYITYQQIENYAIQPKVQSNSTNLTPLTVFASVVIGANLGGLLAGLVAIPVAGCIRVLLIDYLRSRGRLPEDMPKTV